jgi:hypothetical protein
MMKFVTKTSASGICLKLCTHPDVLLNFKSRSYDNFKTLLEEEVLRGLLDVLF